jgi:ribosomal protein L7Ae-like RNA K-turn-binding protein
MNYLALARKAGRIELGEENTGAAIRAGKARLVLLASDASDNARRRAEGFLHGRDVPFLPVPFTKEEISQKTGKAGCSMAAFTDTGLALSFAEALAEEGAECADTVEALTRAKERLDQRRREAKAHEENKRFGKRRKSV